MPTSKFPATRIALSLIFALALLAVAIRADDAPSTATKKPAPKPNLGDFFQQHYKDRVMLFREQNKKLHEQPDVKNVVLLGDSITEGFNVEKLFPDRHVINRGIGADVIGNALPESDNRGVLHRLPESVFDCNPSD